MDNRIERIERILHRWLPVVAGVCISIFVLCLAVIDPYISGKSVKVNQSWETDRTRREADTVAGVRETVDQVAQAVITMDGNAETQRAVSEIVAQNDGIERLWVVDTKGNIVYFGKAQPDAYTVERLGPEDIHLILDRLPEGTLQPGQRTAILTSVAICNPYYEGSGFPDHSSIQHSEFRPIKGGFIAAAYRDPVSSSSSHFIIDERYNSWHNFNEKVGIGMLILYWLSLPLWVILDARRREEKKWAWGFFTLIGNIVGLLIYRLTRREAQLVSCPSCGRLVRRGFNVCAYCGIPLKMLCPSCQHPVEMEWYYCPHCTASLKADVPVPQMG